VGAAAQTLKPAQKMSRQVDRRSCGRRFRGWGRHTIIRRHAAGCKNRRSGADPSRWRASRVRRPSARRPSAESESGRGGKDLSRQPRAEALGPVHVSIGLGDPFLDPVRVRRRNTARFLQAPRPPAASLLPVAESRRCGRSARYPAARPKAGASRCSVGVCGGEEAPLSTGSPVK
jgi:hypothetical protein